MNFEDRNTNRLSRELSDAMLLVGEFWHTWRTSRQMLATYRWIRGSQPDLTGRALYAEVLSRRRRVEPAAVADMLRGAKESFCSWPRVRELRFRDVVHYVVLTDYLRLHPGRIGMRANIRPILALVIAPNL